LASHFRFLTWLGLCLTTLPAADLKLADVEFFESRIRPVLVAECYECHDAKKQKGDLRLDYRDGLLKGGEEGPAIVCRWETQTTKGFMWRDLGLGDWLFDFDDEAQVARLPDAVLAMAKDPAGARAKAAAARDRAAELHRGMVGQVARTAG
jgi:hypothetical protein